MPEAVGTDPLGDPGSAGKPLDRAVGGVAVHPALLDAEEDRPRRPLADVEIKGSGRPGRQGDGDVLAALAEDLERAVATLEVEVVDVGAEGLGDPQTIEGEQGCEGVVTWRAETGLDEEGAEFVAVEAQRPRLVVHLWPANIERRVAINEPLLLAVLVEAGQRRQPTSDGGPHPPGFLHPPREQLEVGPPDAEQGEPRLVAPCSEQT